MREGVRWNIENSALRLKTIKCGVYVFGLACFVLFSMNMDTDIDKQGKQDRIIKVEV